MKKYIAILILLLASQAGYSQTYSVDELFKEFSKTEYSEGVKLGSIFMGLAGVFTETMGVKGIEAYSFDNYTKDQKEKFEKAIANLKDSSYETMVTSNEKDSRTKVLVKIEKEYICELVVVTSGESSAMIRIRGKIKPSDMEKVTHKHGKGGGS